MRHRSAWTVLLLLFGTLVPRAHGCTAIIVAGGATTDGSVLIARSDDGEDAITTNHLVYHPPRDTPAVFRSNANSLELQLPAPGLAYLAMPIILADPSRGRNTSGESFGVNSAGVAVSATESIYNNPAARAADPYVTETGLVEDALPSLLLPQATSARAGASILGGLVSTLGAGEGFGVMIADSSEAWYLETASGHHWMALRVPDDSFFVSANQGRFQEANLSDSTNVMSSPGLEQFAIRAGLFNPAHGRPFNFFIVFMDHSAVQLTYSVPRVLRLQQLFAGGRAWEAAEAAAAAGPAAAVKAPLMPVFMPPSRPLDTFDIMEALRDRFQGTRHDPYEPHMNPHESFRPIAVLRSGNGHIIRVRPDKAGTSDSQRLPAALTAIHYVAVGMAALSPFIPIYKGLPGDALPEALTCAQSEPDAISLFWKARRLQALAFEDWPRVEPAAAAALRAFEADVEFRQRPAFERRYVAKLSGAGGLEDAQRALATFTADIIQQAGDLLDGLTAEAAKALGLSEVPSDKAIVKMLDAAIAAYGFMPPYDGERRPALRRVGRISGTSSAAATLVASS